MCLQTNVPLLVIVTPKKTSSSTSASATPFRDNPGGYLPTTIALHFAGEQCNPSLSKNKSIAEKQVESSSSFLQISLMSSAYEIRRKRREATSNPACVQERSTKASKPDNSKAKSMGDSGQPYLMPLDVLKGGDNSRAPLTAVHPKSLALTINW